MSHKYLIGRVKLEYDRVLDPGIDPDVLDDDLMKTIRMVYYLMKKIMEEVQNLAFVEIDGLVQLVRIDQKELLGIAPRYFLR